MELGQALGDVQESDRDTLHEETFMLNLALSQGYPLMCCLLCISQRTSSIHLLCKFSTFSGAMLAYMVHLFCLVGYGILNMHIEV